MSEKNFAFCENTAALSRNIAAFCEDILKKRVFSEQKKLFFLLKKTVFLKLFLDKAARSSQKAIRKQQKNSKKRLYFYDFS